MFEELADPRKDELLHGLSDLHNLRGMEIGALDKPLLSRTEANVIYADYTDTETLKRNYQNASDHDSKNIVDVDVIWNNLTLADAVGGQSSLDYVVASHVVEHVPNLISWLQDINSVLKPDGTLHLAVPDRRFCFDIRRSDTQMTDVLDAYVMGAKKPFPRQIIDFEIHYMPISTPDVWRGEAALPRMLDPARIQSAIAISENVIRTGDYLDIHCWTFTPKSFSELMLQLCAAGLVNFRCEKLFDTRYNQLEFRVVLKKSDDAEEMNKSWIEAQESISAPHSPMQPPRGARFVADHVDASIRPAFVRTPMVARAAHWVRTLGRKRS